MATVIGADFGNLPAVAVEQISKHIDGVVDLLEVRFGVNTALQSVANLNSNNAVAFTGDANQSVGGTSVPVTVTLVVAFASGTVSLKVPASLISNLTGTTATGTGTFSVSLSSLAKSFRIHELDAGTQVHGLTDGSDSLSGADSLIGGGAMITDQQASFITASAKDLGANTDTLADVALALKLFSKAGTTSADNLGIEVLQITPGTGSNFSSVGAEFDRNTLVVSTLKDLAGATLALSGMEKALVMDAGTVRIDDALGTLLVGDRSNQVFFGGAGADTLIGGGGYDSLAGGGGADVFGFIRRGHYTITDFVQGTDKLLFEFDGVNTRADVMTYLTGVVNENGNTKFLFGPTASITLVGVSTGTLFSDLLFDV